MHRVTITVDDALMKELDRLIDARGYRSRSEAIRDVARAGIQQALLEMNSAPDCVAALVYVFDYGVRALARRLTGLFHDHHDLSVSVTHMHLNHDTGFDVALLKGPTDEVRRLADTVLAERGVRHGRMIIVPVVMDDQEHQHERNAHSHVHLRSR